MGQCWTKDKSVVVDSIVDVISSFIVFLHPESCKQSTNNDTAPELAGGSIHLITTMDEWEKETSEASKDGKIVVVNFSASWCNPCRQIAPAYRELADKYSSILFLTVDVDELAEFSTTWDIKATPTFFFLKDGRQLDKLVGANKVELHKKTMAIAESNTRSQN